MSILYDENVSFSVVNRYGAFIIAVVSAIFFFYFPVLVSFFIACLCFVRIPTFISLIVGSFICLVFAMLVTSRGDLDGAFTAGFGTDILLYKNAFSSIADLEYFNLQDILSISVSQTGSSEPLFWIIVFVLSRISSNPDFIWFAFAFISLLLFLFYLLVQKKSTPIPIIVIFCSTITFYIYQSSVLRQGMAFIFTFIGLNELKKGNLRASLLVLGSGVLIHFSVLIMIVVTLIGNQINDFDKKGGIKLTIYCLIISLLILLFVNITPYLPSDINLFYKIQTRMSGVDAETSNWEVQFLFEVLMFFILVFFIKIKIHPSLLAAFILLCIIVIAGIPLTGFSDRLYRYTYIFYIIVFLDWINKPSAQKQQKMYFQSFVVIMFFCWFCLLLSTRYNEVFLGRDTVGVLTTNIKELIFNSKS